MTTKAEKILFVTEAAKRFGEVVTHQQILSLCDETGMKRQVWLEGKQYRVARGKYQLPLQEFNIDMAGLALVKSQPMPISEPTVSPVTKPLQNFLCRTYARGCNYS